MKNKKGWLKIVEAFVAILLVAGVALIVINRNSEKTDISTTVYETEISILREIQLNNTLRTSILASTPPVEFGSNFPANVQTKIAERIPNYLECSGKICTPQDSCYLSVYPEKEIYAQSVIITVSSGSTEYEPKQLKLFCWAK